MGTSADTERKRVQRAKRKIDELLRQREALKRWSHKLQQERSLFTAATSQLAFRVDSIFPALEADIKNRRDALAAYLATLAPRSPEREDPKS
jgi:ribosomal protein L16 Arg81 hydroxylase